MDVTVKLHGVLRRHRPKGVEGAPHHPFTMNLPATAIVNDIRVSLVLSQDIGFVVAVNGEAAELSTELRQGDVVYFFPPAAGG
ncbi:MAG TPA: MoaD/ThiS family protein [candidate division Zixibacteria bacterium]|nr:MoaD/ThiS family protein [candidate division Zixibacteria bacterium]